LYARGALVGEIMELTADLTHQQVENSIKRNRCRPQWNQREPFSINGHDSRIKRAKQFKKIRSGGLSENKIKSIKFARELSSNRLVSDNLHYWERMVFAYQSKGRNLPVEFSDRLRLEVFLQAVSRAKSRDHSLLFAYRQIGSEIDYKWFDNSIAEEEDFIAKFEDEELGKIPEDERGYYREDGEGRWRCPVAFGENGGIIFDSSRDALKRKLARGNR